MSGRRAMPCALTIAGSDSGGGAGIQADLKTFAALDVHGTSVTTCLTAQNPRRVAAVEPTSIPQIRAELESVFSELPPRAIKTGMLFSREIIETVVKFLLAVQHRRPILVVDPVMIATSGATLLRTDAVEALQTKLLPIADLVTPNVPEAEALTERKIREPEDLRKAARVLRQRFGCAVLLKGGHLEAVTSALDIYYDGRTELLLAAPFVPGVSTHGTGCTYSAAIAAYCAHGRTLVEAAGFAKRFITRAIAGSVRVGKHLVLGW